MEHMRIPILTVRPSLTRNEHRDPDWERRAILKFDTSNTIPAGTKISSATLTLTVKDGLGTAGQTRPLNAYRITKPFQEAQATWTTRQGAYSWAAAWWRHGRAGRKRGGQQRCRLESDVRRDEPRSEDPTTASSTRATRA